MSDKPRVLIVDDNEGLARTMSFVLRRKGFATSTAGDGQQAVQQALAADFDLILMDVKMPQLDGLEAYRRIKARKPDAVVLLMTAYAVDDLVQRALAEGAHGVIYKPLDLEHVLLLVDDLARRRGACAGEQ